jgi:predicted DNA-binding helix-hairpin-helix protein
MQQDARFDVAGDDEVIVPDLSFVRREFKSRANLATLPKMFVSNDCVFNCAYCGCRAGNDEKRCYTNQPKELAQMAVIRAMAENKGIFITSAIRKDADYTVELIIETMRSIRRDYGYKGYIHAKVMPGTDFRLIRQAGMYANRLSVNIEVTKSEGYDIIARNKNKENILGPMGQISRLIKDAKSERGRLQPFFTSSHSTQIMAGSTGESDFEILRLAEALYKKYDLARVCYTPFQYTKPAKGYDGLETVSTPTWRVKRLYQADRLIKLYGFAPEEIAPDDSPNLAYDMDPKAAWALRHIHLYPIEVNTANYESLLRIPGIGTIYAQRIMKARKYCKITHDVLKSLGVSLKRSRHFMTCNGKFQGDNIGSIAGYERLLATPLETADTERAIRHSLDCCI